MLSGPLPNDPIGGGREVVQDDSRGEFFRGVALDTRAVARADEEALFDSGVPAALEINEAVTDHVALGEVKVELVAGIVKELRGGFSSAAGLVGSFGCDIDFFERNTVTFQLLKQVLIYALDVCHGEETAADAGLIGDDN